MQSCRDVGLGIRNGGSNLGTGNTVPSIPVGPRGCDGRRGLEVTDLGVAVEITAVALWDGCTTIRARLQVGAWLAGPVAQAVSVPTLQFIGNMTPIITKLDAIL